MDENIITEQLNADLVIVGGGLGGVAAAIAALRNNLKVILTEETDWIGGQLTSQGVPPDEHRWIETHGATVMYREFRKGIRQYYKRFYPLSEEAKACSKIRQLSLANLLAQIIMRMNDRGSVSSIFD